MACQFRSKKYCRNKYHQGADVIGPVGCQIEVILKENGSGRCLVLNEIIVFFDKINYNNHQNYNENGKYVGSQKFFDQVLVEGFHSV